jgi:hypothetical protein
MKEMETNISTYQRYFEVDHKEITAEETTLPPATYNMHSCASY